MRPMGAFELARAEHQRADARADREHRQLQTEEGLKSHGFHGGGNGHVEGREANAVNAMLNTMNTASNGSTPA